MNTIIYQGHPYYEKDMLSIQDLQEQPLISMNQKYSSYHNFIQRCSDFGFTPNIVLCTMENPLIYHFCQEKIGISIGANIVLIISNPLIVKSIICYKNQKHFNQFTMSFLIS